MELMPLILSIHLPLAPHKLAELATTRNKKKKRERERERERERTDVREGRRKRKKGQPRKVSFHSLI